MGQITLLLAESVIATDVSSGFAVSVSGGGKSLPGDERQLM